MTQWRLIGYATRALNNYEASDSNLQIEFFHVTNKLAK